MFAIGSRTMGERDFDLSSRLPVAAPDHFGLEGFEETFDGCVIVAVSFSAHGCFEAMFSQDFLTVMGTVLGGFNRSSQHPDFGGVDDDSKTEVGALDAMQIILARSTASLAA